MTKPKYSVGDRTVEELTSEERSMIMGIVTRDLCVATIAELRSVPEIVVSMWLRNSIVELLEEMSPEKMNDILNKIREIDEK